MASAVLPDPIDMAWREFHGRLVSFVARRVKDVADAEDIVQQVFLRMHRSLGTLRSADGVGAWLYQTARNAITDHYRNPARRREEAAGDTREIDLRHAPPGVEANDDPAHVACAAECLRPMVDRLPVAYRRAIEKVELQGMTQVRASASEGVSLSGMKARVQRGRQRLKAMLLDQCGVALDPRGGVVACEARSAPGRACPRPESETQRG